MNYLKLWAKSNPYHPLWCHLLDTAAVCRYLLPKFGRIEAIPDSWMEYFAAMHDIGKADVCFQNKDPELADILRDNSLSLPVEIQPFRHEARSAKWLKKHLIDNCNLTESVAETISQGIRGHHADFNSNAYREDCDYPERYRTWQSIRKDLSDLVTRILGIDDVPFDVLEFVNSSVVGVKIAGITVLSDWIASNSELYKFTSISSNNDPADYWNAACILADSTVQRLLPNPATDQYDLSTPKFTDLWPACSELRASQKAVEDACVDGINPGLAIIEAPMGEGKTEAAIYLAECWGKILKRDGVYIAMPTQATSNQMYGRYSEFLNRAKLNFSDPYLIHGMAWLIDDISPVNASNLCGEDSDEESLSREWFHNAKRALLAEHGVGTIDQALMAALNVKFGFLRLLGLSSKILIIDEVHAYDEYITSILRRLLTWCRVLNIPVIMLSATLSGKQKKSLVEAYGGNTNSITFASDDLYPLLTFVQFDGEALTRPADVSLCQKKTIGLEMHRGMLGDAPSTAKLAMDLVDHGGCACVLANTVNSAQSIFKELQAAGAEDIYLFHARFRAEKRNGVERDVLNLFGKDAGKNGNPLRPGKAILVATQVVEQSLDLDFDVMITELAPIDLLLQRSGRLHRHDRGDRGNPILHVLLPESESDPQFGGTGYVYSKELLLRTMGVLRKNDQFNLPDDFRSLIEACYGDNPEMPSVISEDIMSEAIRDRTLKLAKERDEARRYLITEPCKDFFSLAEMSKPVSENEDGEQVSYLRAQTRLGDDSRAVLVLNDDVLITAARSNQAPSRDILRRIFLQRVNIIAWQLTDVLPRDGYDAMFEGANWLRGSLVLPMRDRKWCGITGKDRQVEITDDDTLGIVYKMIAGE
ncbi:MAG: CRISPR-associated helicase Cas3' [Armatimonadota bacterium]